MGIKLSLYGRLTLELSGDRSVARSAVDRARSRPAEGYWSLNDGAIVIDLHIRRVIETPNASLAYRILEGDQVVFSAKGPGERRQRTGGLDGGNGSIAF